MKKHHQYYFLVIKFCVFILLAIGVQIPICAEESVVKDPYIWLENNESQETQTWLADQKSRFEDYLKPLKTHEQIKKQLYNILQYESYNVPICSQGRLFYRIRKPTQERSALYMQTDDDSSPKLLIDPQKLCDTAEISLTGYVVSPNGKYLAFGLSENGSDKNIWKILDIATGENLSDHVEEVKFSNVTWGKDSQGFFYSLFGANTSNGIYYHRLGSTQHDDVEVYQEKNHNGIMHLSFVNEDGKYLMIYVYLRTGMTNGIVIKNLDNPESTFQEVIPCGKASYGYVSNKNNEFYFLTDDQASNGKIVAIDINQPGTTQRDVLPETKYPLTEVMAVGKEYIVSYLENGYSSLKVFDSEWNWMRDITLPGIGTVILSQKHQSDSDSHSPTEFYFGFTNFVQPMTIYRYDVSTDTLKVFKQPITTFNSDEYCTKQVFYPSKDGTQVPMFLVYRKDCDIEKTTETLLYGYGGFGNALTPAFNPAHFAWVERGGILAIANIRGGAEYGEKWHLDGCRKNKQNSFDDFIAAAEWLIAEGYTIPSKLAISGQSNGGLLVAACLLQRPDLFGAASVEVGVLDMLRFHLFSVGWSWVGEYGNPDNPEDFEVLYKYSPYHNVREGVCYPSTLVSTADHDDRVVPLHSYKFAAALQEAQGGPNPILLNVETNVGHGAGSSVSKLINQWAKIQTFLLNELGVL